MSNPHSAHWLVIVGVLISCAPLVHAAEWVKCKRDASTGQLLWMRGKSTEPLENTEFRPSTLQPDMGTCLVSNDRLRKAHGLRF